MQTIGSGDAMLDLQRLNQILKQNDRMRLALQLVQLWAMHDDEREEPREKAMNDIVKKCEEALRP